MPTPLPLPLILEFLMAADREFEERPLTNDERRQLDRENAAEFARRHARERAKETTDV